MEESAASGRSGEGGIGFVRWAIREARATFKLQRSDPHAFSSDRPDGGDARIIRMAVGDKVENFSVPEEPSGYAGWETAPGEVPAGTRMLV